MWERPVTRASVELYDMGERNGGRPAGEGAKTPCSTLEKFKSVKSAQVAVKWGPMLMRQRTMLDLGGVRGVSFWPRLTMKVSEAFSHPELCSTCPHNLFNLTHGDKNV
jgi:hypothetical protein